MSYIYDISRLRVKVLFLTAAYHTCLECQVIEHLRARRERVIEELITIMICSFVWLDYRPTISTLDKKKVRNMSSIANFELYND